jgi:uncharacterized protein (DUF488 family)
MTDVAPEPPTVYTIDHSTRGIAELIGMLREAGVTRLADVRGIPRSSRNPQFNSEALQAALASEGIDYRHMPSLGGRRSARKDGPSRNLYWRIQAFRNYADYAETGAFRAGLETLDRLARERPRAIMCAEAVWWRCHRRLIADYLLVAGWPVIHLMGPGQQQPAELTPGAMPQPGGSVAYPGAPQTAPLPWEGAP